MDDFGSFKSLGFAFLLAGCATSVPTRSVVGDTLSYHAVATAVDREKARFQAEGAALEDLANECSLIPKNTRVENENFDKGGYENKVGSTLMVPLAECMRARTTLEPNSIREVADPLLTARLKLYQDFVETGRVPFIHEMVRVDVPEEMPVAPDRDSHWDDTEFYYVLRQTLAYQKQIAVLAPKSAFATLPEVRRFDAAVEPVESLLRSMQTNNPSLRTKPLAWSDLKDTPRVPRPECLRRGSR